MAGVVEVDGKRVDKPGTSIRPDARVVVLAPNEPYVSRGGRKLEAALAAFELEPKNWLCLDVGASTGGFTDCLLKHGARRVYSIDVGYGQLDYRLRKDSRVVVLERTNARYLEPDAIPERVDLATLDISFISLVKVMPAVAPLVADGGLMLALVKPQFEAGREEVGKGGVVRDESVRVRTVERVVDSLQRLGLEPLGNFDSPVLGAKRGNQETFALLRFGGAQ